MEAGAAAAVTEVFLQIAGHPIPLLRHFSVLQRILASLSGIFSQESALIYCKHRLLSSFFISCERSDVAQNIGQGRWNLAENNPDQGIPRLFILQLPSLEWTRSSRWARTEISLLSTGSKRDPNVAVDWANSVLKKFCRLDTIYFWAGKNKFFWGHTGLWLRPLCRGRKGGHTRKSESFVCLVAQSGSRH